MARVKWPIGINPEMDNHAAKNGMSHWSCVSPKENIWWVRRDGLTCAATFKENGGYIADLKAMDKKVPLEKTLKRFQ